MTTMMMTDMIYDNDDDYLYDPTTPTLTYIYSEIKKNNFDYTGDHD